jgi:hypothetical protein
LEKNPPARKTSPVKEAPEKKLISRSSTVARACSNLKGLEDDDDNDDPILLLSDDDRQEKLETSKYSKKAGKSSDSEGIVLTMLKEADSVFNLPWKDYVSVYIICVTCFVNYFSCISVNVFVIIAVIGFLILFLAIFGFPSLTTI